MPASTWQRSSKTWSDEQILPAKLRPRFSAGRPVGGAQVTGGSRKDPFAQDGIERKHRTAVPDNGVEVLFDDVLKVARGVQESDDVDLAAQVKSPGIIADQLRGRHQLGLDPVDHLGGHL